MKPALPNTYDYLYNMFNYLLLYVYWKIYTRKEQFKIEIKTSHFRHIVLIIVSCCCNKTCKKKKKSASQVNDEDKLLENPQGLKHCHASLNPQS